MGNIMSHSAAPECTELKQKYDVCFNEWYGEKFLKGKSTENPCAELYDEYKTCFDNAMMQLVLKKQLETAQKEAPFEKGGEFQDK